jgi:hypothetical protein
MGMKDKTCKGSKRFVFHTGDEGQNVKERKRFVFQTGDEGQNV